MKILFKAALIFLLITSLAHARVKFIPLKNMPAMADFVIVGTVFESTSRWDSRGVMIYTDYTIQVEENILGDSPPVVVMSFAGGTVGEQTIIVTDTPVLEKGKRYILFSYEQGKYSVPVVGHEQGVFRVVYDSVSRMDFVVDYNWYQLEITDEKEIIRGPLTEQDSDGALTVRKVETPKKRIVSPRPVIRDNSGQEIPQDSSVFAKPKPRVRGIPITKSEFVDFIRMRIHDTEPTR
ncbi:MAG: hypothetical protein JSU83_22925 [Deltaproteobacteria bacterium]|nr:MAG: hypothetical protein JSU83_22925 [Deltaproteobacteria bacterium]